MKKLIIGIVAAVMMSAGLVAASGTAAVANPYAGTVKVKMNKPAKKQRTVRANKKAKVRLKLTVAGNAKPTGKVTCVANPTKKWKKRGAKKKKNSVKAAKKNLSFGKLKRGVYKVTCKYNPGKNSVYTKSKFSYKLKVR